jgi:hypothetical protein
MAVATLGSQSWKPPRLRPLRPSSLPQKACKTPHNDVLGRHDDCRLEGVAVSKRGKEKGVLSSLENRARAMVGLISLWAISFSIHAESIDESSRRECISALHDMVRAVSIPSIRRPSFFVSKRVTSIQSESPTHIYFETKYIKQLRDKAHLSPSQVDRFVRLIKQSLLQEVLEEGIHPSRIFNDYKSIRLEVDTVDPAAIDRIYRRAIESFNQNIDREFSPLEARGKSIRKILEEIPNYAGPFSIGIGRNLNESGIAARMIHLPHYSNIGVHRFADIQSLLYDHFRDTRKLHQKMIQGLESSLSAQDFEKLTMRWGNSIVLRPEVNDLFRKSSQNNELSLQMHRRFRLDSIIPSQLIQQMSDFYNSIKVFETPLSYGTSSEPEIDAAILEELAGDAQLTERSDFVVSIDIRRVGAFHASALQAAVTDPAVNSQDDFLKMISSLSYGASQKRYDRLMTEADDLLSATLAKSQTLASKSSGDEIVRYFKGPYHQEAISKLLNRITPEMRATMIPLAKFKGKGINLTDDEVNEMRHVAETLAKTIHEELGDEFGSILADDFHALVELQPSTLKPGRFDVKVHFQTVKSDHAPLIELALQRIKEAARDLLSSKGVDPSLINRINSIQTRAHKAPAPSQLPPK